MGNRQFFRAIAIVVAVLAVASLIGAGAYNAGVSHAISMSARAVEAAPPLAAGGAYPYPYFAYGWHRPWGFGFFPFFPIFPILFVFFFFFVLRGLFWRGPWQRGGWAGGVPPAFDEWHRRAHAQGGASSPREGGL